MVRYSFYCFTVKSTMSYTVLYIVPGRKIALILCEANVSLLSIVTDLK